MPTDAHRWSVTIDCGSAERAYTGDIPGAERPYTIADTDYKKHDKDLKEKIGISPHHSDDFNGA